MLEEYFREFSKYLDYKARNRIKWLKNILYRYNYYSIQQKYQTIIPLINMSAIGNK